MTAPEKISPTLKRSQRRRQVDFDIMTDWIPSGSRVLDLGCGRGILLEALAQKRGGFGLGVDSDFDKVASCIKRGLNVYHGDLDRMLGCFPDRSFDFVIFSRTVEMIEDPGKTLLEAARVGRRVIVGFINRGYWRNRLGFALKGSVPVNDVYPLRWEKAGPSNHLSVREFESFCRRYHLKIRRASLLAGDWRKSVGWAAAWRAGYALYEVSAGRHGSADS